MLGFGKQATFERYNSHIFQGRINKVLDKTKHWIYCQHVKLSFCCINVPVIVIYCLPLLTRVKAFSADFLLLLKPAWHFEGIDSVQCRISLSFTNYCQVCRNATRRIPNPPSVFFFSFSVKPWFLCHVSLCKPAYQLRLVAINKSLAFALSDLMQLSSHTPII